LTFNRLGVIL